MWSEPPKITIGVPVYNGERYLAQALESILRQSFTDFELVISDNASTDSTSDICRQFAARDARVIYDRSRLNLGASPNFNRLVPMARGRYFCWIAHDDLVEPDYLQRCVAVLDGDPGVVLAHTQVRIVDQQGRFLEDYAYRLETSAESPSKRFYQLLFVKNNCYEVFGLIRLDTLRQTGLIGSFPVGDRVLLSELAFRGRFHEVPERLFVSREHGERSVRQLVSQRERAPWFDVRHQGKITLPECRTFAEYLKAIRRAPLSPRDRLACELLMLKYLRHYRKRMRSDLLFAAGALGADLAQRTRRLLSLPSR